MTEPSRNVPYEDSDMRQVIGEIETMLDEQTTIKAKSAADCGVIARRVKARKKAATSLGIKTKLLNRLLKQRALERQLRDNAGEVDEADAEIFLEASGQFSMFAPVEGEELAPKDEPVAKKAARRAAKVAEAHQAREQEEGKRVLDSVLN